MKLGTCIFRYATEGTSIKDFSISVKDPLPDHKKKFYREKIRFILTQLSLGTSYGDEIRIIL